MAVAARNLPKLPRINGQSLQSDLESLWAKTLGDPRVAVAVLDGPVDQSHPCFHEANLTRLPTLISETAKNGPAGRHGTHVASVIFGRHDSPVRGIAPKCRGLLAPIFFDGPDGLIAPCSQLDLARAITQAVESGARIINISGGQLEPSGEPHDFLAKTVEAAAAKGALIVAAAGNDGCECLHVPAAAESVLVVGALQEDGSPLNSSNWSPAYRSHGILAPGVDVPGAAPGGMTTSGDGTSFATAIVSGIAALLLSLQLERGRQPNARDVMAAILSSAIGCGRQPTPGCERLLAGRLNVAGTMAQILHGDEAMPRSVEIANETSNAVAAQAAVPARPHVRDPTCESAAPTSASDSKDAVMASPVLPEDPGPLPPQPHNNTRGVAPAECSCVRAGNGIREDASPRLVYALGQLGFDFGTEARRDSIMQQMEDGANPHDHRQLLAYLERNPADAVAILWTLSLDATPIYVLQGKGPYARNVYDRLREFLSAQVDPDENAERISAPGRVVGTERLMNGQVVPVIAPELRGMFNWTTAVLVERVCGSRPTKEANGEQADAYERKCVSVRNFLDRVYHELRNLGLTSEERAINFSATNAFNVARIFESALKDDLDLDAIEVERSPICRPESDCWDVKLTFFNPAKVFEQARKVFRFTVDVSDVVPVTVGTPRSWFVR